MIPDISIFDCPSKLSKRFISNHFPEFWELIDKLPGRSAAEKLYMYYHGLNEIPLCEHCGVNPKIFKNIHVGYRQYCCNHCSVTDPNRRQKAINTLIDRFGVDHPSKSKEIFERIKKTNQERYGGTGFASKELLEKTKQTNRERYGVEWTGQSDKIKEKTKQTNRERYGVEHVLQSDTIKEKAKQTNLERYGVEYAIQNPNIKKRQEDTLIERYGVNHPMRSDSIKQKVRDVFVEHYGVDNPMKSKEVQQKAKQTNRERYGVEYVMQHKDTMMKNVRSRMSEFISRKDFIENILPSGEWICKCPHDETFRSSHNVCKSCDSTYLINSVRYYGRKEYMIEPCTNILPIQKDRMSGTSIELFIRDILDSINILYEINNREILNGKELDIYIPEKRIAIECNGIYWHSESNPHKSLKDYHYEKWKACNVMGIQLLTVWEDQIRNFPEIVRSVILSKLGIYEERIPARKCRIKPTPTKIAKEFLTANHIQGSCNAGVKLGLYYNEELVGLMCFSKRSKVSGSKNINDDDWELVRFCTKLNTQVIGGADKLFKSFIKTYKFNTITSFSSNDISSGSLYKTLGFNNQGESTAYWYINPANLQRYHRIYFSKQNLIKMGLVPEHLENEKWTEFEVTDYLGLLRIYDSGHIRWVYELKNKE